MHTLNKKRRGLLLGLLCLPFAKFAKAALPTPSGTEGPFYPTESMRYDDIDNDLVRIDNRVEAAGGEIIQLKGRVFDRKGNAIAEARVEIWQCDARGKYLHRAEPSWSDRDPGFQGFGFDLTNTSGEFNFRTIKPVPYPGRTPHIHLKVLLNNQEKLTTQLYLADHPGNQRDWLFRQIPPSRRDSVTMRFDENAEHPLARISLVV